MLGERGTLFHPGSGHGSGNPPLKKQNRVLQHSTTPGSPGFLNGWLPNQAGPASGCLPPRSGHKKPWL